MPANLSGWLSHGKVLEDHTKKQEKVLPEVIVACLDTSNPYMMITELTMTNILQKYKSGPTLRENTLKMHADKR